MELTKELREKFENAESKEEVKKFLKEAGVELTDEEMNMVSGGISLPQTLTAPVDMSKEDVIILSERLKQLIFQQKKPQ